MTYKVLYAGMDSETWFLLVSEPRFSVLGAAKITALTTHTSWNPFNALWRLWYARYSDGKKVSVIGLRLIGPFLSSAWRKYHQFFLSIVQQNTAIIDFDDTSAVLHFYKTHSVDVLVVNVWNLLPLDIINGPSFRTINIHPSKLPQYRGSVPTLMTLKNHDKVSAVSYIILDDSVDGGSIIGQHEFKVESTDDYRSIEDKVAVTVQSTFVADMVSYLEGKVTPIVQDHTLKSSTPKYHEYMSVNWLDEAAADVFNKVNLYPYVEVFDYCYSYLNGRKIFLKSIKYASHVWLEPGSFRVTGLHAYIGASDGTMQCLLFKDINKRQSMIIVRLRAGKTSSSSKEKSK